MEEEEYHEKAHAIRGQTTKWEMSDKATLELDAQKGSHIPHLFNFGHSWWNLNINPTNINPYLIGADPYNSVPVNLSLGDPFGPQGMGGFYDHTNVIGPGQVIFANPQPDLSAATNHVATGSYYWCLSFANYLSVLQNVWDLSTYPPEYRFASVNCTTEAEAMAIAGGIQNVPPTIYPGYLRLT